MNFAEKIQTAIAAIGEILNGLFAGISENGQAAPVPDVAAMQSDGAGMTPEEKKLEEEKAAAAKEASTSAAIAPAASSATATKQQNALGQVVLGKIAEMNLEMNALKSVGQQSAQASQATTGAIGDLADSVKTMAMAIKQLKEGQENIVSNVDLALNAVGINQKTMEAINGSAQQMATKSQGLQNFNSGSTPILNPNGASLEDVVRSMVQKIQGESATAIKSQGDQVGLGFVDRKKQVTHNIMDGLRALAMEKQSGAETQGAIRVRF